MKLIITILCLLAFAGCAPDNKSVVLPKQDYLVVLQALELNPKEYKSYQQYHDIVLGKMKSWLESTQDPSELERLFYDCHAKLKSQPDAPQEQLQWIDPFFKSLPLIMYRLSDLRTEEAARIMVDLYCDKKVGWDAHFAEMGADAIARCPELTLPILKKKQKSGADVSGVIELLESGTKQIH